MTYSLLETLRRIVREEMAALRTAELAVVQDIHPHASDSDTDNYACTVALRDTGLVLARVPLLTSRAGFACVPAVGHLVLVQFVGGNINAPVITGSLYNDEERPPVNDDGKAVMQLPLGDSSGVHVEVESIAMRRILVRVGDALEVELKDDDPVVKLDVGGKALVQIDSDGAVTLESSGDIGMKGNGVSIEAQSELKLKGAQVNVTGNVINLN